MKRRLFFSLGAIALFACSGGGSSDDPGELQRALEAVGLKTISAESSKARSPLIVVGGLTDPEGIAQGFADFFKCRGEPFDAVFLLDTRSDPSRLEPVAASMQRLTDGLSQVAASGTTRATVLGTNTGGLAARAALKVQEPGLEDVEFISIFTPFAGLDDSQMRPGYPDDFRKNSPFVTSQGSIASEVRHKKIVAVYSEPDTLVSNLSPDGVFIAPQSSSAVDGDPQLAASVALDIRNWPFSTPQRFQEAFDALGFAPNSCPDEAEEFESVSLGELAALGAAQTARVLPKNGEGTTVALDTIEFASQNLEIRAPGGVVDTSRPFAFIIHGQDPQPGAYNVLESQLVAQGYEVFRFVYDEDGAVNPDLGEIAEDARDAKKDLRALGEQLSFVTKALSERTGVTTFSFFGHSNGGNIAHYSASQREGETLAGSGLTINIVNFATPAEGVNSLVGASGGLARFGLKVFGNLGGEFYLPLTDPSFSQAPLGTNVFLRVLVSDESSFDGDYVITIAGQIPLGITSDPQFIDAEELGGGEFTDKAIQVGHTGGLFQSSLVDYWIANMEGLRELRGDNPSADPPPPTPTPTPRPRDNNDDDDDDDDDDSDDDDDQPTPTPTATPAPTPTPDTRGAFLCPDGTYTPSGSGCGLGSFALNEQGSTLVVDNFGSNSQLIFTIGSTTTASGTGIVIFNVPDHSCGITCSNPETGEVAVGCSNQQGGSCSAQFTR